MKIEEMIGKTVTNIYSLVLVQVGGLDTGECFIELNNKYIIDIPFAYNVEVLLKQLNNEAVSLFTDLSDYPVYYINKNNKTVGDIAQKHQQQRRNIFNRLRKFLFGQNNFTKDYEPYKIEYRENNLKHVKGQKIVDFIWYANDSDKGLLLLENGYLITETTASPHGTGLAGLNYFESIADLIEDRGSNYLKLSDVK